MCFSLPESDELHQLDPGDSVAESDWENESSCAFEEITEEDSDSQSDQGILPACLTL